MAHAAAEHRLAGDLDLALFRGVRRGHRLADHRDRRRELRRLHRAGPDHADAADAEHRQRLVRHLLSRSSPARSTSCCRRRSPISRSCSAMSARPPPSRLSSGLIILATAGLFVPLRIDHPVWMVAFLVLTAVTFSLFGFIIGIWADGFEKLQVVPLLIITPLTFLGGSFYSIDVLPPVWQTDQSLQSCSLSDQRLSLELLRHLRRRHRHQPRHDHAVLDALPWLGLVDFQHRLSAEELARHRRSPASYARATRPSSILRQVAIETVGPEMPTIRGIDELRGDLHAVPGHNAPMALVRASPTFACT